MAFPTGKVYKTHSGVYRKQHSNAFSGVPQPVTTYFTIKAGICQAKTAHLSRKAKTFLFPGWTKVMRSGIMNNGTIRICNFTPMKFKRRKKE